MGSLYHIRMTITRRGGYLAPLTLTRNSHPPSLFTEICPSRGSESSLKSLAGPTSTQRRWDHPHISTQFLPILAANQTRWLGLKVHSGILKPMGLI